MQSRPGGRGQVRQRVICQAGTPIRWGREAAGFDGPRLKDMPKNTGRQFEKLTQQIFAEVLNRGEVRTVEVRHDVTLAGKTTNHQVDVYWEFERGGIRYITVVQAKDWTRLVGQGELLKFKEVLDDLPHQPRGVFVVRAGYQAGALTFAAAHGILLYVLREPTQADSWQVNLNLSAYCPRASDIRLIHDEAWRLEEAAMLRLTEAPRITIAAEVWELAVYDQSGRQSGTVKDVIDAFYPGGFRELPPTRMAHRFEQPTFIRTGVDGFPRLKIDAVEAIISVDKFETKWAFGAKELVGFILEDVTAGTALAFDR